MLFQEGRETLSPLRAVFTEPAAALEKGDDPRKAPNHGLRHWWKSTADRIGLQDSLADAIQGHAGNFVASIYRRFDLETLAKGVASIPVPGENPIAKSTPMRRASGITRVRDEIRGVQRRWFKGPIFWRRAVFNRLLSPRYRQEQCRKQRPLIRCNGSNYHDRTCNTGL